MFIASEHYRGRLLIEHLRLFSDEESAHRYASKFSERRVYEMFYTKKPRLCKTRKKKV